jgi:hypothetical protein
MSAFIKEKINSHYGNWTVLEFDQIDSHSDARWWCRCEICGEIYSVKGYTLRNGHSTKCLSCAKRRYERD